MHSSSGSSRDRAWVKGENEADSSIRQKLLGDNKAGSARRSYGSVVNRQFSVTDQQAEARAGSRNTIQDSSSGSRSRMAVNEETEVAMAASTATSTPGYRCLKANSVSLPPQKWYKHLRIPGVFNRTSPRSNAVHTTKYTIITFIPKNLWEQAHRWANLYFIFIALLNFVPAVEAVGKEIGFIPVIFVLAVTAIKDIFEDYRRYRSDREENGRTCKVYDWESNSFLVKKWSELCVGDFVCLECDEVIPADILLLHSSDANDICYIETASIDGETNLKQRVVASGAMQQRSDQASSFSPKDFTGALYCEAPHNKIYDFNGYIIDSNDSNCQRTIVNRNHLLLRGCIIRNTTKIIGIVAYAGHDTKALLNNTGLRAKRSKLEKDINVEVIAQVVLLLLISIAGAIGSGIWTAMSLDRGFTFFPFSSETGNHPALEAFIRFWTFIILYQVIIPISLYVTIEIVKFIQIYFINWDRDMYYAPTDTPFQCRALNISEDLGQIQYVFSDKTGTLTENQMVFRCCSIDGINYPHTLASEFEKYSGGDNVSLSGRSTTLTSVDSEHAEEMVDFPMYQAPALERDRSLAINIKNAELSDSQIDHFFITMAICNTVVVSNTVESGLVRGRGSEGVTREKVMALRYEAESPDEAALVEAARAYGYALLTRSPSYCAIFTPKGEVLEYDVLHVLEFDSTRKCMSIIVKEKKEDAEIIVYSKGADSAIYANLVHPAQSHRRVFSLSTSTPVSPVASNPLPDIERGQPMSAEQRRHEAFVKRLTQDHLDMYARLGLRILCLAKRVLGEEEYERWKEERESAELSVEQREDKINQSNCNIEQKLQLLGATGIEDRLQEGVPDAIDSLKEAGMKVWVLTGDKQETAINIGFSSHLIDDSMDVIAINAYDMEQCKAELLHYKGELEKMDRPGSRVTSMNNNHDQGSTGSDESDSILSRIPLLKKFFRTGTCNASPVHLEGRKPKALVIDGPTLHYALDPALKCCFLAVAQRCHAVICCRATPLQKAAVVDLVKVNLNQMTLAIGDGANDISMMQKANVGVGIAGKEGMQAVMASDFAMARFKFLVKLLLVHGHWCYSRLANMMYYFFYKNVAYALLLFWYQFFSAYSGARVIDSINLIIFNFIYTSVPIMVVAIADQVIRAPTLMKEKHLYEEGRRSKVYTRWKSWLNIFDGVYQSLTVFFVAYGAYYTTDVGITEFGFVINISIVIVVSLHLAVETLHWTIFHHVVLWGSIVVTFAFNYIYTAIDTRQRQDTLWIMQRASTRPEFWLVLLITPAIALLPRMVAKVIEQEVFPSEVLKVRAKQSSFKPKRVEVSVADDAADVSTNDVSAPPPSTGGESPPTRSHAPPTSLPIHSNTNSQAHDTDNQVNSNNHII